MEEELPSYYQVFGSASFEEAPQDIVAALRLGALGIEALARSDTALSVPYRKRKRMQSPESYFCCACSTLGKASNDNPLNAIKNAITVLKLHSGKDYEWLLQVYGSLPKKYAEATLSDEQLALLQQ